jgi:hypothetical protein
MASAGTIIDYAASYILAKQQAELYELIYPYGAEDFVAHPDNNKRHAQINSYIEALTTSLNSLSTYIQTHIHQAQGPFSPTSVPIVPLTVTYPTTPPSPVNTTGAKSNLTGNILIPYEYLSYVDLRTSSVNRPISVFKRSLSIPITTTVITPELTRQ